MSEYEQLRWKSVQLEQLRINVGNQKAILQLHNFPSPKRINLKAYPNPVIDITTLEINASQVYSKLQIVITNMHGQVVYKKAIAPAQNTIKQQVNMSSLIKGMYTITIYFGNNEKKIIKVIRL